VKYAATGLAAAWRLVHFAGFTSMRGLRIEGIMTRFVSGP